MESMSHIPGISPPIELDTPSFIFSKYSWLPTRWVLRQPHLLTILAYLSTSRLFIFCCLLTLLQTYEGQKNLMSVIFPYIQETLSHRHCMISFLGFYMTQYSSTLACCMPLQGTFLFSIMHTLNHLLQKNVVISSCWHLDLGNINLLKMSLHLVMSLLHVVEKWLYLDTLHSCQQVH